MKRLTLKSLLIMIPLSVANLYADDGPACSTKDFRGIYALLANGINVTNNRPLMFAGSITADGNGKITAWKDWVAQAADPIIAPNFKLVPPVRDIHAMALSVGNEILYTVETDCRITISSVVPDPTGALVPIRQVGALAAKGDEALLINGASGSPSLMTITLKRAKKSPRGEDE